MTTNTPGIPTDSGVSRRLRILEAVVLMQTCVLVVLLVSGWTSPDGVVSARKFQLLDEKDGLRGVWSVHDLDAQLVLYDKNDKVTVGLYSNTGRGAGKVTVGSSTGEDIVTLSGEPDKGGRVTVASRSGDARIRLECGSVSGDRIEILDDEGEVRWSAPER